MIRAALIAFALSAMNPSALAARPVLLLVAPSSLDVAAAAWTEHRTADGWRVRRIGTVDGAKHDLTADSLRARLREAAQAATADGAPNVAVLLLGDVRTEPGHGIPTFHFDQRDPRLVDRHDPRFASDHPYQLLDDADEAPDLALGRVPARSVDEALAVLAKVCRYEFAPVGGWRAHVTFIAGEGRFGFGDAVMEQMFRSMVDTMLPPRFGLSMTFACPTSAYCPPPSTLEQTIASRFAEPAVLVNYLGHGSWNALDRMHWGRERVPLLRSTAAAAIVKPNPALPIAFMGCCSVGWYDRADGQPSLAETMLVAPGGPIALIAGSRPTHPYGTAALQKNLVDRLVHSRATTIGELDLMATRDMLRRDRLDDSIDMLVRPIAALTQWPCSFDELRLMHVRMYNLLGDPCTRVALPPPELDELVLDGATLRGRVDGASRGQVVVTIETDRPSHVGERLVPAAKRDDPELERIAAANYPRVNERVLWMGGGSLVDGTFSVDLPNPMPQGAVFIRCIVALPETVRLSGIRLTPQPP